MAKVLIGNFKGPQGDKGDKGDPGTAATIQVGTTQTVQPEENAEVTNTGTANAAVLNFKIPRGEDGMTDLTAEYTDASEYTCEPTVNAPVVVKQVDGKTEQVETTGANILAYPYKYNSRTMHGVTFTVLDNGKVKTQGEATEDIIFVLNSINFSILSSFAALFLRIAPHFLHRNIITYPFLLSISKPTGSNSPWQCSLLSPGFLSTCLEYKQ